MRRLVLILLAACGTQAETPAPPPALPTLEQAIRARIAQADSAEVALSLIDLSNGRELHINGDVVMHAASTMKVPVLLEILRQVEAGTLALDSGMVVTNRFRSSADTSHYSLDPHDDSEFTLYEKVGQRVPLRELARLMIVRSSNLATNLLIDLVDVEDIPVFERGLNNTTTSRGFANVLAAIARCGRYTRRSCDSMLEILEAQEFREMIPAGLPAGTRVAHKTGSITRSQHDGGIVFPPNRAPYVLVVLTRGFNDEAQAKQTGADISRLVWNELTASAPASASASASASAPLTTRVFTHAAYWSAVEPYLGAPLEREQIGASAEGRPLYLVRYGTGKTKVLLWSQMHGDESTATLALADLMRYLHETRDARTRRWQDELTILMVPMLNPDGAETFQRQNAMGIDVNRDARALVTPEARTLKAVRDRYQPEFGFNLHDQNARTRVGNTDRVAAIALLAPAFDSTRSDNAVRTRAKQVASVIRTAIEPLVPGRVA
ncbi:MAG: serine hydrolase, partial [Gemmatimonadota bacterium]